MTTSDPLYGKIVTVLGGSGYVGRHLAQALLARGARLRIASAFVHVSALGTDAGSTIDYSRTKAEGEAAVLAAFPTATVVRASLMFGPDDTFVMMFADLIARLPALPVFAPEAKLQPVFVDDVAEAIGNALADSARHGGKTYELAGPEVITMLTLNQRIATEQGRTRHFAALPDAVGGLIAASTGWLPGAPITSDQFKQLQAGSVATGTLPGIADLGVSPKPLSLFLDRWMVRFRKHGRFGTKDIRAA